MPINRRLEYTVLDMIETATRNSRAAPLNLGGFAGVGGGVGGPPGGFIGRLPQYQVTYDEAELATLDTLPSGNTGSSGWSLVDNLNHIRYRIGVLESGGGSVFSGIIVIDGNNSLTYTDVDILRFVGSGVVVTNLGGGQVQIQINDAGSGAGGMSYLDELLDVSISGLVDGDILIYSGGDGLWHNVQPLEDVPFDNEIYGRQNGTWVIFSGGLGDAPADSQIYGRQNNTWVVISGTGEEILHKYNDDLTSQVVAREFITSLVYISGTLRLYYNGIRQRKGIHYLDDVEFTIFSTYFDTYSGDSIVVDYDYYLSQQTGGGQFSLVDSDGILLVDSDGIELTETI